MTYEVTISVTEAAWSYQETTMLLMKEFPLTLLLTLIETPSIGWHNLRGPSNRATYLSRKRGKE